MTRDLVDRLRDECNCFIGDDSCYYLEAAAEIERLRKVICDYCEINDPYASPTEIRDRETWQKYLDAMTALWSVWKEVRGE